MLRQRRADTNTTADSLLQRTMQNGRESSSWALSQLSVPPQVDWWDPAEKYFKGISEQDDAFLYYEHPSSCENTFLYVTESAVLWNHDVRRPIVIYILHYKG